jgi:hypothetical protein
LGEPVQSGSRESLATNLGAAWHLCWDCFHFLFTLSVWNKHDFCQGWAEHYSVFCVQASSRARASGREQGEAKWYLIAAELHQLVSQKDAAVHAAPGSLSEVSTRYG